MATQLNMEVGDTSYTQYVNTLQQLRLLKEEGKPQAKANLLKRLMTYFLVTLPPPQEHSVMKQLHEEYTITTRLLTNKVHYINCKISKNYNNNSRDLQSRKGTGTPQAQR